MFKKQNICIKHFVLHINHVFDIDYLREYIVSSLSTVVNSLCHVLLMYKLYIFSVRDNKFFFFLFTITQPPLHSDKVWLVSLVYTTRLYSRRAP